MIPNSGEVFGGQVPQKSGPAPRTAASPLVEGERGPQKPGREVGCMGAEDPSGFGIIHLVCAARATWSYCWPLLGQWFRGSQTCLRKRPAVVIVAAVLVAVLAAGGLLAWRANRGATLQAAAAARPAATLAPATSAEATPSPSPSAAPTPSPTPAATPSAAPQAAAAAAGAAPRHFTTLPPGSRLPASAQCAAWVAAVPYPENKRVNRPYNQATGQRLAADFSAASADDPPANTQLAARVDGAFTGSTGQVLRWTACKWGVDEDIVLAQAAKESWWRQTAKGDWASDPSTCAPGHGLGVDGQAGQCPNSFGILQDRYSIERSSW